MTNYELRGLWRSEMQGTKARVNTDLGSAVFSARREKCTSVPAFTGRANSSKMLTCPTRELHWQPTELPAASAPLTCLFPSPEFLQQVRKKKPWEPGSPPCNNKSTFQTPRFKRKHHHSLVAPPIKPINMKLPLPRRSFVTAPRPRWQKWLTFPLQHIFAKLYDSRDSA